MTLNSEMSPSSIPLEMLKYSEIFPSRYVLARKSLSLDPVDQENLLFYNYFKDSTTTTKVKSMSTVKILETMRLRNSERILVSSAKNLSFSRVLLLKILSITLPMWA